MARIVPCFGAGWLALVSTPRSSWVLKGIGIWESSDECLKINFGEC